jgi:hypothetical protein
MNPDWTGTLRSLTRLLPFFALYVSFGATFGFLTTGAPLILRVRGVDLAQIGLLQVMNLPLGLTFLWAGIVDRYRLPRLPHRVGWIGLMQSLSVVLLLFLAASEHAPLVLLFALGTATTFCVATMDISLEALVVETVPGQDRIFVSTAKFCGASLGGILGAGVLAGSYEALGWQVAVGCVALVGAAAALPILIYPETRLRRPEAAVERPGGRLGRLRSLGAHVAVLGFYFAALHAISGFNGLALVDLGLTLSQASLVSGTLLPVINLTMSFLAGLLVRRFGTVRLVTVFAVGMAVSAASMVAATATGWGTLGAAATLTTYCCSCVLGVPVFNMLYRWSEGPRAATDYALLFGAAFFASMPVRVGGPALAAVTGWTWFFAGAIPLYLAAALVLRGAILRTSDRTGPASGAEHR